MHHHQQQQQRQWQTELFIIHTLCTRTHHNSMRGIKQDFVFLILRYLSLQLALGGGSCPSGSRDTRNNMPQLRLETDEHILVEDERGMEKWGLIKKSRFINSSPRRRWIIAEPVPNGHSFSLQPDEEEDHQPPIFDAPMVCCQIECNLSGQAFSVQSIWRIRITRHAMPFGKLNWNSPGLLLFLLLLLVVILFAIVFVAW